MLGTFFPVLRSSTAMIFPWPSDHRTVLFDALDIALSYLEAKGLGGARAEEVAGRIILHAYETGTHHKIALANKAIVAVESAWEGNVYELPSVRVMEQN